MLQGLLSSVRKQPIGDGNYLLNLFTSSPWLLLTFTLIYAAIHLLTWALMRNRRPIDEVLLPFAAFAPSTILESVKRKHHLIRLQVASKRMMLHIVLNQAGVAVHKERRFLDDVRAVASALDGIRSDQ